MGFVSFITDTAKSAWDWVQTDTGTAVTSAAIGGAATGAMDYYAQKQQQKNQKDLYDRSLRDADERRKASSLGGEEYGTHNSNLTGGMLTQGKIANLT